ncbi:glycoside hydrolase family 16 protein [Coniophora puteana RWD-64-598 SS2]|uniref:Glycoside hydrolase family 16 protein n=1 Tax=Coniophora puteana (strain RWD-64-598) TaxID=741705 RepID=A0A5M3MHX3_CONPW|nr:glycoside hydrolase family 16 protein [Coniophora puteana RWD-64-598 SS2]EIW78647.1 glycoside hydrolase family 16 protein [Coniophora puteana RWD-64-598 SS2]
MFTAAFIAAALPLLAAITPALAQGQTCNATSQCSSDYPCCSEYGFCNTGTYCLGGCNPLYSNTVDSCMPMPICESKNYTLSDTSRILSNATYYNGNASEYDWIVQQGTIMNATSGGQTALAMLLTENGGGTLISSTRYVHYGQITARMKTGRWAGVVTAFITMSDIKDEIDWEFPGNITTTGQTNYFWQGSIPAKTNGVTESGLTDTYENWHDFTLNWQPDALEFLVDGNVTRTLKASDTVVNGVSQYPNTPSRIQLSIWPAGISSEPAGTVQWAGGMINWQDPDYTSAGHFYAYVDTVSVTCNDPSTPTSDDTSYVYGSNTTTDTPSVSFSNATTEINAAAGLRAVGGAQGALAMAVAFVAAAVTLF